jgi:hypothetical protein
VIETRDAGKGTPRSAGPKSAVGPQANYTPPDYQRALAAGWNELLYEDF